MAYKVYKGLQDHSAKGFPAYCKVYGRCTRPYIVHLCTPFVRPQKSRGYALLNEMYTLYVFFQVLMNIPSNPRTRLPSE